MNVNAAKENGSNGGGRPLVLLVQMPFGSIQIPSLGLSLLRAELEQAQIPADLRYFNIRFAGRIGVPQYLRLTTHRFPDFLWNEWVFAKSLFRMGTDPEADAAQLRRAYPEIMEGTVFMQGGANRISPEITAERISILLSARRAADGFVEECAREVLAIGPELVGFTTSVSENVASLALARRLKELRPGLPLVFGGNNCEGTMGEALLRNFPFLDAVVSGEGDFLFAELVRRYLRTGRVSEIAGRHDGKEGRAAPAGRFLEAGSVPRMDDLACPAFDDYFAQLGALPENGVHPWVLLETARGCWWADTSHCTFCGFPAAKSRYRSKSPEQVLAQIRRIDEKGYDRASCIYFTDMILDMKYFETLFPELSRRKQGLKLSFDVKSNLKKSQVRQLHEGGVSAVQVGIESLSSAILQIMQKGNTALRSIMVLKWCRELAVYPIWTILFGFPGEPPEEYEKMAALIPALTHLQPPQICSPIHLDRFSPNFKLGEKAGFKGIVPHPVYRYVYPLPEKELADLVFFFKGDYADGRDVPGYTESLRRAVSEWWGRYETDDLSFARGGEGLRIRDTRRIARRREWRLSPLEAEIYLALDETHTREYLREHLSRRFGRPFAPAEVDALVGPMLENRLMLEEDGYLLSLAVDENALPPEDPALRKPLTFEEGLTGRRAS